MDEGFDLGGSDDYGTCEVDMAGGDLSSDAFQEYDAGLDWQDTASELPGAASELPGADYQIDGLLDSGSLPPDVSFQESDYSILDENQTNEFQINENQTNEFQTDVFLINENQAENFQTDEFQHEADCSLLDEQNSNECGSEINPADDIGSWISDVNPGYDPFDCSDSPYNSNCGSCALATFLRLEGENDIEATVNNIETPEEMESITGMEQVAMSPEEIERTLLEQGDGAHAIIGIDRDEGPGHWFNAVNKGGKVMAADGQTGELMDWPPDYGDVIRWDMSVA